LEGICPQANLTANSALFRLAGSARRHSTANSASLPELEGICPQANLTANSAASNKLDFILEIGINNLLRAS
jgi:hypothetical protein